MLRRLAGPVFAALFAACTNAPADAVPCAANGQAQGVCPVGQVCGSIGCRPCEGSGECGEGKLCCAGTCTRTEECSTCRTSLECGAGRACCDGRCAEGECCTATDCNGRACTAHHCAAAAPKPARPPAVKPCTGEGCATGKACVFDGECGSSGRCCGGTCVQGDCCGANDCDGRVCGANHRCEACTDSAQCGAGAVCCGGVCTAGDCCAAGDCESGQICTAHQCGACTSDLQCGTGESCCAGQCTEGVCQLRPGCRDGICAVSLGGCIHTSECASGLVCSDGRCIAPTALATFAIGQACSATNPCTGFAEVCCNNVCVSGECCTDSQCPAPLQCLQNACQSCTSDGQCGGGRVCCNGTCQTGSCCPGAPCPAGQICSGFQCVACTLNTDCGSGQVCCSGVCRTGNCCTTANCGSFVCVNNSCAACRDNADCGAGGLCCGGACVANATCCTRSDCPSGQICTANRCAACSRDTDCGFGLKCCGGSCKAGDCCSTSDCTAGRVCNANYFCATCSTDSQCAVGQKCCSGLCTNGTCCQSSDCGVGRVCTNNSCQPCTSNSQCGSGQLCCNGGCQTGNCCSNSDCTDAAASAGGRICTGNLCTNCQSDAQCGAGAKCCRGACYAGRSCCTSADCTGSLACNAAGQCASCAADADCGGQRCCMDGSGIGRCAAICSVSSTWSNPMTFALGTFNGTTASGSPLNPACVPGTLCWAGSSVQVQVPYLWIPVSGEGTVYRYNTNTGARAGPFNTGVHPSWPTVSGAFPGDSPSRTSVNPFDGTVWIANRGFSTYASPQSGAAHIDYNGTMLCYAPVPGVARAMALDAAGNAWVGSYFNSVFYKFSGTDFEVGTYNPKRCKLLTVVAVPGSNPYGAAVDNRGDIWIQDCPSCSTVSAISSTTNAYLGRWSSGCGQYGLTVDRDYVWLGCYYSSGVGRLTKAQSGPTRITRTDFVSTGGNPRGLASSPDGFVYAGMANNQVAKIHRTSMSLTRINVPTSHSITAAVDGANRIWAVDYYGPVVRIDPNNNSNQTVFGGSPNGQYVYTDVTGQQTINAGLTPGLWNVIYDSMYPTPRWLRVQVQSQQPVGTSVEVRVRASATSGGLPAAPWSVWFSTFPANLSGAGVPSQRYLEIQVKLVTASDTTSPVVTSVTADWSPF